MVDNGESITGWWLISTPGKSIGMMTFPTEWESITNVPKHQPEPEL